MVGMTGMTGILLSGLVLAGAETGEKKDNIDARSAFEVLKKLAGDWEGTTGTKDGSPAQVSLRLSSARRGRLVALRGENVNE